MIIIGMSRSKSKWKIGSKLIRMIGGTDFSHVYFLWHSDSIQRWMVYQATGRGGVNFMNLDRFLEDNQVIREYFIIENQKEHESFIQFCVDNSGDHYGKMQIIGMTFVKLVKFLGGRSDNPLSYGQVCCEMVLRCMKNVFGDKNIDSDDFDEMDLKYLKDLLDEDVSENRWKPWLETSKKSSGGL